MSSKPCLRELPQTFSIFRWAPATTLPPALAATPMCFISRTDEELSVLCPDAAATTLQLAAAATEHSPGWSGLAVIGPLDFSIVGLLADLSRVLAEARISLFAVSTYDTDYLFVQTPQLPAARAALAAAGYPCSPAE